jgi:glycerol-3-phosphate dehydrogenase
LADEALDKLGFEKGSSTAFSPLPGGDIFDAFNIYLGQLAKWMPQPLLVRLSRAYGTRLPQLLNGASCMGELGRDFGAGLHEVEIRYLQCNEFARTAEDILWRRTKLGLHMTKAEREAVAAFVGA